MKRILLTLCLSSLSLHAANNSGQGGSQPAYGMLETFFILLPTINIPHVPTFVSLSVLVNAVYPLDKPFKIEYHNSQLETALSPTCILQSKALPVATLLGNLRNKTVTPSQLDDEIIRYNENIRQIATHVKKHGNIDRLPNKDQMRTSGCRPRETFVSLAGNPDTTKEKETFYIGDCLSLAKKIDRSTLKSLTVQRRDVMAALKELNKKP